MTFHIWVNDGLLRIAIGIKPSNWAVRTTDPTQTTVKLIAWFCGGWFSLCGYNYAYYFESKEQAEHFCFLMGNSPRLIPEIEEYPL